MGVFVPLLVQPARQCPCNGSSISGTVSARAMGATPSSIIVADMQAMTGRDSFVMTSAPLRQNSRSCRERGFQDNHVNCYFLDKRCHCAAGPARCEYTA